MAKLDDEQVQQFRTLIREEVAPIIREEVQPIVQEIIRQEVRPIIRDEVSTQLDQKLQPMNEKLDQIRTTQIEDSNALAAAHVKLSDTVGGHERRIKKLERARA